ncbi:MAG: DUF1634 domain-containing protein [Alphaproteobacteria bacterium]|nr:DUF1634 domain-containing protein [Alphaproteobacteria bacterium]MDE2336934.1 DUF1634 domain-containing protein [Alphaproteobacteria bacterium]
MTPRHTAETAARLRKEETPLRKTELAISNVLRGGVLLSIAVILAGIVCFYVMKSSGGAHFSYPDTLSALWRGLAQGRPLAIVMLGLVILLATPVIRVAVSIAAFAVEGDRTYVGITGIVLLLLLFSIFGVGQWLGHPGSVAVHDDSLRFFLIVLSGSLFAGLTGALVGLGGGVFIVPLLTLGFHVPFMLAVGASIVSVIATSSGAAAAYVRDRMTNLRIGMFLEIATAAGAIVGAALTAYLDVQVLFVVFGAVLLVSVLPLVTRMGEEFPAHVENHKWAERLRLPSVYPDRRAGADIPYKVAHIGAGFSMMCVAGLLSGLLGIGSGVFKVLAMDTFMRLPMKVSTTTSNFMIGVTAAASAGIFFQRGDIDPMIAAPVALGVLAGATLGAKLLTRLSNKHIRMVFAPVIVLVALNMLARGLGWL